MKTQQWEPALYPSGTMLVVHPGLATHFYVYGPRYEDEQEQERARYRYVQELALFLNSAGTNRPAWLDTGISSVTDTSVDYANGASITARSHSIDDVKNHLERARLFMLLEIPGAPELPEHRLIKYLWKLLDDIDTTSDAVRGDNAAYRERVEKIQRKRFDSGVTTNGYNLDITGMYGC